jgi:hypothetical protein
LRLGLAAMRNPMMYTPAAAMAAWLPVGLISTESIKDVIRRVVRTGWTDHPNTWIVACDRGGADPAAGRGPRAHGAQPDAAEGPGPRSAPPRAPPRAASSQAAA